MSIKLTHLSFADDKWISFFLGRTIEVFDEFARISGLCINIAESTMFVAGVDKQRLQEVAVSAGFSTSGLPVKYLGLPLTTKIMSRSNYEPLLAKIKARFQSWTSKSRSFTRRLMLVKSVINSITNFWCSAFWLPKACIDIIDSMFSAFLWSGSPKDSIKVKVSWREVCRPMEKGGLGVRKISDVSTVFSLKLIWRLLNGKMSLWADWMRKHLVR